MWSSSSVLLLVESSGFSVLDHADRMFFWSSVFSPQPRGWLGVPLSVSQMTSRHHQLLPISDHRWKDRQLLPISDHRWKDRQLLPISDHRWKDWRLLPISDHRWSLRLDSFLLVWFRAHHRPWHCLQVPFRYHRPSCTQQRFRWQYHHHLWPLPGRLVRAMLSKVFPSV